jgi:hypothetical protein
MKKLLLLLLFTISQILQTKSQSFTNKEIYNFQPGDIIQKEYDENNYNIDSSSSTIYTIDSFINKITINNSSVKYTINRKYIKIITPNPNNYTPKIFQEIDTLTYNNIDSTPIINPHNNLCQLILSSNYISTDLSQCNDSTWNITYGQPFICGMNYTCYTQMIFYKGLGGPYYNSTSAVSSSDKHLNITFYKKNNITCGQLINMNSLLPTGINNIDDNNDQIIIYPNPTNTEITIEGNIIGQNFKLYDLNNNTYINTIILSKITKLNINYLINGTYIYNINGKKFGKIIKNN